MPYVRCIGVLYSVCMYINYYISHHHMSHRLLRIPGSTSLCWHSSEDVRYMCIQLIVDLMTLPDEGTTLCVLHLENRPLAVGINTLHAMGRYIGQFELRPVRKYVHIFTHAHIVLLHVYKIIPCRVRFHVAQISRAMLKLCAVVNKKCMLAIYRRCVAHHYCINLN